jgi:hypothetical protein
MTRKTLRNIIWVAAAALAIAALKYNPDHLVTAGMIALLGSFQDEPRQEDDRYEL